MGLKQEILNIQNLNEAVLFIKKKSLKFKTIQKIDYTNTLIKEIENEKDKSEIIRTIKIYETDKKKYLMVIYDYKEGEFGKIESMTIAQLKQLIKLPNPKDMLFSLTRTLTNNASYKKTWYIA